MNWRSTFYSVCGKLKTKNFNYRLLINLANTNSSQMLLPTNSFQVHKKKQCALAEYQKKNIGLSFSFHFALECQTFCEPKRWYIENEHNHAIHHLLCACGYIICAATFFKAHRIDKWNHILIYRHLAYDIYIEITICI